MKSEKWSLKKAAIWGAVISPLGLLAQSFLGNAGATGGGPEFVGYILGGMIGGAFLFCLVAALRNLFV